MEEKKMLALQETVADEMMEKISGGEEEKVVYGKSGGDWPGRVLGDKWYVTFNSAAHSVVERRHW